MIRHKRLLDLAFGVPVLVVILPLFAGVALANWLSGDRGPLLYRGTRVGEDGRPFQALKLRTMRAEAGGPALTQNNDPRVTPVGRFLRRFKLDELPQFWNVVRGEMTLVGPRPEDPAFVDWSDPLHAAVFRARPGITGLAQLAYVNEETLHVGERSLDRYRTAILPRKLALDQWYLAHSGLRLDAKILLRTVGALLAAASRDASNVEPR